MRFIAGMPFLVGTGSPASPSIVIHILGPQLPLPLLHPNQPPQQNPDHQRQHCEDQQRHICAKPAQRQQTIPWHHRVRRCARTNGACASLSERSSSRRVCCFFIASRKPGKAGCFGIGRAPHGDAQVYQIALKVAGFSDVP